MKVIGKVLGIESSCDETAVAVVDSTRTIHVHRVRSQIAEHTPYGGVVPEIAARNHILALPEMVKGLDLNDIDAVAVTSGPGLIGGLVVGMNVARGLALALNCRFLPINHLEAHALVPRLSDDIPFPYLLLLVSGGHTQLLAVLGVGQYKLLGTTLDDAVGEAFDKVAKMLELSFPGGPHLEKLAINGQPYYDLPRPMAGKKGCGFSFSGLKTAVRYQLPLANSQQKAHMAYAFQNAVCDSLSDRCRRGIEIFQRHYGCNKAFVVAGGVAANQQIRQTLQNLAQKYNMAFHAPPLDLCTDNGVMVAWAGMEHLQAGDYVHENDWAFKARPRWPLEEIKCRI